MPPSPSRSPTARRRSSPSRRPRSRRRAAAPPQYTQVFGDALVDEVRRDRRVVGITAAMNSGTGLNILQKAEPEHYFDVGIAEQQAVLFAAGLALEGAKPVCAIYSTFLQRAFDQIVHDVCLQELDVIFAMDRAGLVGDDGPTHHGVFDIAYLRCLPNITLAAPRDEAKLKHLLRTALTAGRARSACATRAARASASRCPIARRASRSRSARGEILREGDARRAARLRQRRRQGAGGGRPARRGRAGGHGRRRALRQAAGPRADRRRSPPSTSCWSPSRRACCRAASARRSGRRFNDGGRSSVPRILRVGLPDRYVTHGKPALLHAEVGFTGRGDRPPRRGRAVRGPRRSAVARR